MATTLEYDIRVQSVGLQYGQEAAEEFSKALKGTQIAAKKLDTELDNTEQSAKDLEASLKRQEARIKTLDGAINVLGGSVELAVGTIGALGLVTEEQAEQFQAAALGAIAFADGAKRTFDGIKSLNEGLAASGGLMKTLNAALLANPAAATAAAIVALGAAIGGLIYYLNQSTGVWEEVNDGLVENVKLTKEQIGTIGKQISDLKFLESVLTDTTQSEETRNNALKELQKIAPELEGLDLKRADAIDKVRQAIANEIGAIEQRAKAQAVQNKLTEFYTRQLEIVSEVQAEFAKNGQQISEFEARFALQRQDQVGVTGQLAKEYQGLSARINESTASLGAYADIVVNKSTPATTKEGEQVRATTTEILNYVDAVNKRNEAIKAGIEGFIKGTGGITQPTNTILQQLPVVQGAVEQSAATFADYLNNLNTDLNEFFESNTGKAVAASLNTANQLASTLAKSQNETTKEGFENAKKYKIAEVVTSAIQSSFQAFGAAQQFGPVLGPVLGAAQVAAIAIASKKAIADIQSSQFGGSTTPSTSTPSVSTAGAGPRPISPSFGAGGFLGQPQGTLTPITMPAEPLRAYVVSSDVTNGLQADAQLARRRTLGPG